MLHITEKNAVDVIEYIVDATGILSSDNCTVQKLMNNFKEKLDKLYHECTKYNVDKIANKLNKVLSTTIYKCCEEESVKAFLEECCITPIDIGDTITDDNACYINDVMTIPVNDKALNGVIIKTSSIPYAFEYTDEDGDVYKCVNPILVFVGQYQA